MYMGNSIDIEIMQNGNLKLSLDSESQEALRDNMQEPDFNRHNTIGELFEDHACNGSYTPFNAGDANPFVGLTDAPCIAETMEHDDEGNQTIEGRFWHFAEYQIACELEQLAETGETVFILGR